MLRSPWPVEPRDTSRNLLLQLAGWLSVACMGVLVLTQAFGWTRLPAVYVLQGMTPYLLMPSVPLAIVACWYARHVMALVSACVAIALMWLTFPVVFPGDAPRPAADGAHLTIAHANVYVQNPESRRVAQVLLDLDADVIAVTEFSKALGAELHDNGIDASHPYSVERAPGNRNGVALFSRYPIQGALVKFGHQLGIDATIDVEGTPIRVMVVHPLPATSRWALHHWRNDLPIIGTRALAGTAPTVVIGDFNASRWHPAFRRLLGRGFTDAHEQLGHGFSMSWPADWSLPPFVRLDHALTTDELVATDIDDFTVPGSDHRGFIVTIATT